MVFVAGNVASEYLSGFVHSRFGNVADGGLFDVVFAGIFFHAANVGLPLPADSNVSDVDAVVGANHPPCGRRLALPVNRGFNDV